MKTWLTIPNAKPLFQNEKWSIEKISEKEIAITDGWKVYYAFINKTYTGLLFDTLAMPQYIRKKALQLAKKEIKSIYA